jgi:hypothetical protein
MRNLEGGTATAIVDANGETLFGADNEEIAGLYVQGGSFGSAVFGTSVFGSGSGIDNPWEEEELIAGMFVALDFSVPLYYSTFDIDLVFEGHRYLAGDLRDGGISFSSGMAVDRATVEIENCTKGMSSMLLNNDQLDSTITISAGAINPSTYQLYDLVTMFKGTLVGWTLNKPYAQLNVAGVMARWNRKTLRTCQSFCPWPFKGDDCGYTGNEGTCSQLWANCRKQENFGGFVYLAELQERKIYWGQLPPS